MAIDEASRGKIAATAAKLRHALGDARPRITWVRPEGWHVTLKFFGDVATDRLAALGKVLQAAAREVGRFELGLRGLLRFPASGRARALVVGVTDDGSAARLASAIDTGATALGFESESRDYVPHLTVARLRDAGAARSADDLVKAHGDVAFGAVPVKEIGLYESVLDRNGAIYRRVEAFPLMRGCV